MCALAMLAGVVSAGCAGASSPSRRPKPIDIDEARAAAMRLAEGGGSSMCLPVAATPSAEPADASWVLAPAHVTALGRAARPGSRGDALAVLYRAMAAAYLRRAALPAEAEQRRALAAPVVTASRTFRLDELGAALAGADGVAARREILEAAAQPLEVLARAAEETRKVMTQASRSLGLQGEQALLAALYPGAGVADRARHLLATSAALLAGARHDATRGEPPLIDSVSLVPTRPAPVPELARAWGASGAPAVPAGRPPPLLPHEGGSAAVELLAARLSLAPAWLAERGRDPRLARGSAVAMLAATRLDAALVLAAVEADEALGAGSFADALAGRLTAALGVELGPGLAAWIAAHEPPFWCAAARLDAALAAATIEAELERRFGVAWWQSAEATSLLRELASAPYLIAPDLVRRLGGAPLDDRAFLSATARAILSATPSRSRP